MAGQGIERREILRVMALAAAASQFPGFRRWTFACGHLGVPPEAPRPPVYTPQFFAPDEYSTVERLCDLIIPGDGSPGAPEAGVSEFIDFMVASDPGIQYGFRYGLTWLDAHSQEEYAKPFRSLSAEEQTAILKRLAYKDRFRAGEEEGRRFFNLIREYTIMGYYTSRVGLEEIDFPGLKLYSESPGCPHGDDPEHLHLPPPKY